jgi:hypothetical protein
LGSSVNPNSKSSSIQYIFQNASCQLPNSPNQGEFFGFCCLKLQFVRIPKAIKFSTFTHSSQAILQVPDTKWKSFTCFNRQRVSR